MKTINKALDKLKKHFFGDVEALAAISLLEEKLNTTPIEKNVVEKMNTLDNLVVPKEVKENDIALFCDGACRGNPGPGSYATIGQNFKGETIFEATSLELNTTNNKMELSAAITALKEFEKYVLEINPVFKGQVYLYSDSKYVIEGMSSWINGWKARDWKKADGKAPENIQLWQELDQLNQKYFVNWLWVKGHAGHPQNEYCDQLCNRVLDDSGL